MVEAIRNRLYMDYESSMESNTYRSTQLANAFSQNRDIDDYSHIPKKLKKLPKKIL